MIRLFWKRLLPKHGLPRDDKISLLIAPKKRVVKALESLGFQILREREHIAMIRENTDGTKTPLTMPNHSLIKGSTLRTICNQSGISREDFLRVYEKS